MNARGDAEACEDVVSSFREKMARGFGSVKSIDEAKQNVRRWADSEAESEAKGELVSPAADAHTEREEAKRLKFDIFDENPASSSTRSLKRTTAPAGPTIPNPPSPKHIPSPKRRRTTLPKPDLTQTGGQESQDIAGLTKKDLDVQRKADETFTKTKLSFSSEEIWNKKLRKRAIDAAVKSMNGHISALLPLMSKSSKASDLSSEIQLWTDDLQKRFDFLQSIRSDPFHFVDNKMTAAEMEVVLAMNMPMVNNLILQSAAEAAKGLDQDSGFRIDLISLAVALLLLLLTNHES